MLRAALSRTAQHALRQASRLACRPIAATAIRFNSTQNPPPPTPNKDRSKEALAKKARLEKMDDLQRDWDAPRIDYNEFLPLVENPQPNRYIIDVREPDEVIQGMIPSAVNLPLSVLSGAFGLSEQRFREQFGFEKPTFKQELIFYCRAGVRSRSAADIAKRNGYTNLYSYDGSWLEWIQKQNEKTAKEGKPQGSTPQEST